MLPKSLIYLLGTLAISGPLASSQANESGFFLTVGGINTEKDGKKHKMKFKGDADELKALVSWVLTLKQ